MKLTPEQLKDAQDALAAENNGEPWEWQDIDDGAWTEGGGYSVIRRLYNGCLVRPVRKPALVPWSKPEDVPGPVCWIRLGRHDSCPVMVVSIWNDGIIYVVRSGTVFQSWRDIASNHIEYSIDRKTWQPCLVEAQP
jgi:hypothetical protein